MKNKSLKTYCVVFLPHSEHKRPGNFYFSLPQDWTTETNRVQAPHLLISHSPETPHEELPQASEPWALGHKGYRDPKAGSLFSVCLETVSGSTPVLSTIVWDPLQPLFPLCSSFWGQRHHPWAPADSCSTGPQTGTTRASLNTTKGKAHGFMP